MRKKHAALSKFYSGKREDISHRRKPGRPDNPPPGSSAPKKRKHVRRKTSRPTSLDLRGNGQAGQIGAEILACAGGRADRLKVQLRNVKSVTAPGALYVAATLDALHESSHDCVIEGTFPRMPGITGVLDELGFWKHLKVQHVPEKHTGNRPPRFVKILSGKDVQSHKVLKLERRMQDNLDMRQELPEPVCSALSEAMTNVAEHAHMDLSGQRPERHFCNRWWLLAHKDLNAQEMHIVFCDLGWGMVRTLEHTERGRHILSLFGKMIVGNVATHLRMKAAMEAPISRTGETNRGQGTRDIKAVVDAHGSGEATIFAHDGMATYMHGGRFYSRRLRHRIAGTMIEWRLPLAPDRNEV